MLERRALNSIDEDNLPIERLVRRDAKGPGLFKGEAARLAKRQALRRKLCSPPGSASGGRPGGRSAPDPSGSASAAASSSPAAGLAPNKPNMCSAIAYCQGIDAAPKEIERALNFLFPSARVAESELRVKLARACAFGTNLALGRVSSTRPQI